jgi:two-component system, OmpR family, response regulator
MREPLRVYIVEDSLILSRLLTSAIEASGAEVTGCSGEAEAAIAGLFASQPDIVVIDISLKSGSGFDVLKVLQEHNLVPETIKVVLTNHATAEYQEICTLLGADRFFDKMETAKALAFISTFADEHRQSMPASRTSRATVRA